jgi:hypothetical protein
MQAETAIRTATVKERSPRKPRTTPSRGLLPARHYNFNLSISSSRVMP